MQRVASERLEGTGWKRRSMKPRAAAQRLVSAAVAAACSSKQLSPKTSNTERDHLFHMRT